VAGWDKSTANFNLERRAKRYGNGNTFLAREDATASPYAGEGRGAKHILLFRRSRSGKTTVLVMAIIYRAIRLAEAII
jgi:hypothetical protein